MTSTSCYSPLTILKPSLYGLCVVCLSGKAQGSRKQISYRDLGQSFPSTPRPSSSSPSASLPFIRPYFKGQPADSMPLSLSTVGTYSSHTLIYASLTCVIGNLFMSVVYMWGQLDVVRVVTRQNVVFMAKWGKKRSYFELKNTQRGSFKL